MARVTQFVFNIPQKETTYLYKEVFYSRNSDINNTGVANLTLKLTVRQNIDQANAYKFFNTIEGGFFKYKGYNSDAFSRMYTPEILLALLLEFTLEELLTISPVIMILNNTKVLTEEIFTLLLIDSREE